MPLQRRADRPAFLWRLSPSSRFVVTAALESFGDGVARTVLPIVAVSTIGAGAGFVGLLNSLSMVGFVLLSLPLGVLADRTSAPVALMSASSLIRAIAVLAGAGWWSVGFLEGTTGMTVVVALAVTVGVADAVFTAGRQLLPPRLVPIDEIRPLVGAVQSAAQASSLAAPMALAALLSIVAAPVTWVIAAAAYVASLLTQSTLRSADSLRRSGAPSRPLRGHVRDGIAIIWTHPQLRLITSANVLVNASSMVANTMLPVIALQILHLPPAQFAALGSVGAVTGILGAAVASRVTVVLGLRWTRVGTSIVATLGVVVVLLLITLPHLLPGPSLAWLGLQYAASFFSTSLAMVAGSDLLPRLAPRESLGAAGGAHRTLVMGAMAAAALGIGALASITSMQVAVYVWLALPLCSVIPALRLRRIPE